MESLATNEAGLEHLVAPEKLNDMFDSQSDSFVNRIQEEININNDHDSINNNVNNIDINADDPTNNIESNNDDSISISDSDNIEMKEREYTNFKNNNLNDEDSHNNNESNFRFSSGDAGDVPLEKDPKKRKVELLFKIHVLKKKNVVCPVEVGNHSSLEQIEMVYKQMHDTYSRETSIQSSRKMTIMLSTIIEFLNTKFDPCDIELTNWSGSVYDSVNSGDYDEIFDELYDKYHTESKMSPEVRFIMMLGGSALMHHTMQKTLKNFGNFTNKNNTSNPMSNTQQKPKDMSGPSNFEDLLKGFKS